VTQSTQSVIPFLHALASTGGSDLHCKVGSAPRVRVDGRLRKLQVGNQQLAQPPRHTHARGPAHHSVHVGAPSAGEGVQEPD
jgi:hypothetical protein